MGDVCNTINIAHFGRKNVEAHEAENGTFEPSRDLRRSCIAENGEMVLIPAEARVGDLVVVA